MQLDLGDVSIYPGSLDFRQSFSPFVKVEFVCAFQYTYARENREKREEREEREKREKRERERRKD